MVTPYFYSAPSQVLLQFGPSWKSLVCWWHHGASEWGRSIQTVWGLDPLAAGSQEIGGMEERQMGGSWQSLGGSDMSAALQVEGAAMSAQGETACLERDHAIRSASPKP